jgi:N-acyl-D-amino-acid deacylase
LKQYDLAITNALVVDGTGAPPRVDDVAIRGDRIQRVGRIDGPAKLTVDAFDRVLSPGFVDLHGHSDYSLLLDPAARSKVFQGITTEVGGNCGYHAAPVFGQVAEERKNEYLTTTGLVVDWSGSAEYRARLSSSHPSINYAQQIGYNTLRSAVTADHARPLTTPERDQLRSLIRTELEQGAVGLSYGLAYAPACFSRTEELIDAAEETAAFDRFVSFHIRNEDETLIESLEEALHIGKTAQVKTHIGHLKTFRRPNWPKIDRALAVLDEARESGLDLTVDRYPHLAMNTQFKFILPTWALEGGAKAVRERLKDPATRMKIVEELSRTVADEASEVLISLVGQAQNKHLEGRFLDDLAEGKNPWELVCDIIASEGDAVFGTFFGMNRDNLDRILSLDYAVVASDASIQAINRQAGGGRPHPRCFDCFPYFLAEWVFARRAFPLETAVAKITRQPALRAGLDDRGLIAEGARADLVIFDPMALRASVSYEEPIRFPDGIETVIVNGAVTVTEGRHTGARAGEVLLAHKK